MAHNKHSAAMFLADAVEVDVVTTDDSQITSDDGVNCFDDHNAPHGLCDDSLNNIDEEEDEGLEQCEDNSKSERGGREASRRQQLVAHGPKSGAVGGDGGKVGGLLAGTSLMLQTETSDSSMLQIAVSDGILGKLSCLLLHTPW